MNKRLPTLELEQSLWKKKYLVIGIDEVGRGALAGPVGVGAVCFDPSKLSIIKDLGINDSKKLSPKMRNDLSETICEYILASSVTFSSVSLINSEGIITSVNKAIRKSVDTIRKTLNTTLPFYLLLDAFYVKYIPGIGLGNQKAIIKGDETCISIAAASILAKVQRDMLMTSLSEKFKPYKWQENKGYGTESHLNAIQKYGATKLHRTLYIRNVLKKSRHFHSIGTF